MSEVNIFETLPEEKFEEGYDPSFVGLPLRKGRYEATVKFRKQDVPFGERWGIIQGNPLHVWTRLVARVEGKGFSDGFISTKPYKAAKDSDKLTSAAVKFLRAIGKREEAEAAESPKAVALLVTEVIGDDGVRAVISNDWETDSCKSCRERGLRNSKETPISVRGEDNFPKDREGNPVPEVSCPQCGETLKAKASFSVVGSV